MKPTLLVFVIGQSPRPEVEAQIASAAPGVTVRLEGALDGMTREQIETEAAPRDDADTLFTVLPSGETTTISKAVVTARLATRLGDSLPALLCCTGAFKGLPQRATIVQPSAVLNGLAASLLPAGTLGLFVPLPEQVETLGEMRARPGLRTVAVPLRPLSDAAAIDAAAAGGGRGERRGGAVHGRAEARSRHPGLHVLHAGRQSAHCRDPRLPDPASHCGRGARCSVASAGIARRSKRAGATPSRRRLSMQGRRAGDRRLTLTCERRPRRQSQRCWIPAN